MTLGRTVFGSNGASFTWWYLPANVVREEHLHDPDRLDQPMGAINTYGSFLPQVLPKTRLAPSGLGGDARHKEAQRTRPLHAIGRSEEHTSELQSLAYLVCRLLLEKKKKITPDDK